MTLATPRSSMATTTLRECAARDWDVVVVGAGPAGTLAAREIARLGSNVLLVEKAPFPRWKVCGCCLNGAALDALESVGLRDLPEDLGARPTTRWQLCTRAGHAVCSLPRGVSLSRTALDAALAQAAIDSGANFLDQTQAARIDSENGVHHVALRSNNNHSTIRAKVVVAADGLAGRVLSDIPWFHTRVQPAARLGAAVVLENGSNFYEPGTIYMSCGRGGYVGLVRLEDGRLEVAAAFDRPAVRRAGSPSVLAAKILAEAQLPLPAHFHSGSWRGTPALTRRPAHVAARRTFLIGDAAGYIEPFTGEGIAWAITTGIAVAPLADQAALAWDRRLATSWAELHRRLIAGRQRYCRVLARMLRTPALANIAAVVLRHAPWLAAPLIRAVSMSRTKNPLALWQRMQARDGDASNHHNTERLVAT